MSSPRRGVIDIGSNSVRLVIYEGPSRAPIAVFNEKTLCGLGDREPHTGALRDAAMADALSMLRRFQAVLDGDDLASLTVFATAATREAPNGPAFLDAIRAVGFEPDLITGEEEARLAALGVLSGAPELLAEPGCGLAGDMGGGSLELSLLQADAPEGIAEAVSLPLGGLRLATLYEGQMSAAKKAVNAALAEAEWLRECQPNTFYLVGGAWRALARMAIARDGHPLPILDHYAQPADRIVELCRLTERQSPESLLGIPGVQKRRAPTLPFAAMVLRKVVQRSGARRVAISSSGVREGTLFASLTPQERAADPLLALCRHYADRLSPGGPRRPGAIHDFLTPAFAEESEGEARLRRAAAILANIGGYFHPDGRAEAAGTTVLSIPFVSLDHPSRVVLACTLYQRHRSSPATFPDELHSELLTERQAEWCRRVGLGLRLATDLDPAGRGAHPAALRVDAGDLVLTAPNDAVLAEGVRRRMVRFAEACELTARLP